MLIKYIDIVDDIEFISFLIEGDEIAFVKAGAVDPNPSTSDSSEINPGSDSSEVIPGDSSEVTPVNPTPTTPSGSGLSGGAVAGIIIGSVFGALILACVVLVVLNKTGVTHIAFVDTAFNATVNFFKKAGHAIKTCFASCVNKIKSLFKK